MITEKQNKQVDEAVGNGWVKPVFGTGLRHDKFRLCLVYVNCGWYIQRWLEYPLQEYAMKVRAYPKPLVGPEKTPLAAIQAWNKLEERK